MRVNVYHKITIPFFLVILLGMLTTLPYGVALVHRLNLEKLDRELSATSRVAVNYLQVRLDEILAYAQSSIYSEEVRQAITRGDAPALRRLLLPLKTRLRMGVVAVYAPGGRRIMELGQLPSPGELDRLPIVRQALLGINSKSVDIAGGQPLLLAGVPNESPHGMEGALIAGFQVDDLFLQELASMIGHDVALLTPDGRPLASNDPRLMKVLDDPLLRASAAPALLLDGQPQRLQATDIKLYNVPVVRVAVISSLQETTALRNRILRFILAVVFLGTLLIMILGILVARSIVRRIRKLLFLTAEVGRGNLDVRVERDTGDEIGDLTVSFNRMVQGLRQNVAEIDSARNKIARYARELEQHSLQLQHDKREIEVILEGMRDGLIMVDAQGTVVAINPEAASILGCNRSSAVGQELDLVLGPFLEQVADRSEIQAALQEADEEEGQESTAHITLFQPRKTIYRVKLYPVYSDERRRLGRILVLTNVTREKETEELKNNFLATISHELRTPLTSIKGSINLILDGNLGSVSQDQREFILIANQNADRLISLVNNLLDLARMEAGDFMTRKIPTDLLRLVKKALSEIKALAVQRGMVIDFTSTAQDAPVLADPERTVQVVSNLVDNALKFSPRGTSVLVSLAEVALPEGDTRPVREPPLPAGSYFRIQVIDGGAGIPPDQLELIFDKFHQADMSSTRSASGSGLGLAIARTIIHEHGGAIWAENRIEGGSRFSFLLPRAPAGTKVTLP